MQDPKDGKPPLEVREFAQRLREAFGPGVKLKYAATDDGRTWGGKGHAFNEGDVP